MDLEFAITIAVEFQERIGGSLEFLGGDAPVAIAIECGNHGRGWRASFTSGRPGRTVAVMRGPAFASLAGRAFGTGAIAGRAGWRIFRTLRGREARRDGEREREEEFRGFHGVCCCLLFLFQ